ncbi:hypothetical protein [Rhodoblastus sp.]
MLGWLQALTPREDAFFAMFERHARFALKCARIPRTPRVVGSGALSP